MRKFPMNNELLQWILVIVLAVIPSLAAALPGDADSSFHGNGKAVFDNNFQDDYLYTLVQDKSGRILAGGTSTAGGILSLAVLRLNSDGYLDASFAGGGKLISSLARSASKILIQEDGKIVTAGTGVGGNFTLVRFDSGGTPDSSFGSGGVVSTDFGGLEGASDAALLPDGRILAAGSQSGSNKILMTRYLAGGTPDGSFGSGGKVVQDLSLANVTVTSVAIQPDGKIVVGGYGDDAGGHDVCLLMRFSSSGVPDSSFGNGGLVTTVIHGVADYIYDITIDPPDRILAAGTTTAASMQKHYWLARYSTKGVLETSTETDLNVDSKAHALAFRADGRIVVTGSWGSNFGVLQYDANLQLDSSFGSGGVVSIDYQSGSDEARAALVQGDGKIVVAGTAKTGATITNNFAFLRLEAESGALLTDAFANGTQEWTASGPWQEYLGWLIVSTPLKATAYAPTPWNPSGMSGCTTCTLLTTIRLSNADAGKVTILAWNQSGSNAVQLVLNPAKGKWVLKQKANGSMTKAAVKKAINENQTYYVGLSYDGSDFLLSIDGQLLARMPAIASPSGNVGFKVKNASFAVDQVDLY